MALTQIKPAGLSKPVDLADNEKIRLGTGNDLEIYHNGNNSYIQDTGTGNLHLTSNGTAVSIDKGTSENMGVFNIDGSVELYHNGAKKLETTANGIEIANGEIQIYNSSNEQYIVGTGNIINIRPNTTENAIRIHPDGAVELYHDNTLRFQTNSIGAQCQGVFLIPLDNEQLRIGAGSDLRMHHDGTNSVISNNTGTLFIAGDIISLTNAAVTETYIKGTNNGAVELYYDNNLKAATYADGLSVTGSMLCGGGIINSTGGNAHIVLDSGTGSASGNQLGYIDFKHNGTLKANISCVEVSSGEPSLDFNGQGTGAVKLYNAGSLKLYTHTNGVVSVGNLGVGDHTAAVNWVNVIYAGDAMDLQFKHDANNSIIENYTGDLYVQNHSANDSGHLYLRSKGGENSITCFNDGGVDLYHDGTKKLSTTANGICFNSDTAAANALDDYEEGSFNPVIGAHNTTTGQQTGNGFYTKVGNRVHMNISFNNVNTGSIPNGAVIRISSLPFAVVGVTAEYVTVTTLMTYGNVLKPNSTFYSDNGNAWLTGIYASETGGQWNNTPTDDFNNGAMYLNFGFSHRTS